MDLLFRGVLFIFFCLLFFVTSLTDSNFIHKQILDKDGNKISEIKDVVIKYEPSKVKYELILVVIPLFSMALGLKLDSESLPLIKKLAVITGSTPVSLTSKEDIISSEKDSTQK